MYDQLHLSMESRGSCIKPFLVTKKGSLSHLGHLNYLNYSARSISHPGYQ